MAQVGPELQDVLTLLMFLVVHQKFDRGFFDFRDIFLDNFIGDGRGV